LTSRSDRSTGPDAIVFALSGDAAPSRVLVVFGAAAPVGVNAANALAGADNADLFAEISRGVDTLLWQVEAHGQAKD
jgi:hypothetical protein